MKSVEYFRMVGKVNYLFIKTHGPMWFVIFSQSCGIKFEFDIRIILYKYTNDVAEIV